MALHTSVEIFVDCSKQQKLNAWSINYFLDQSLGWIHRRCDVSKGTYQGGFKNMFELKNLAILDHFD